MNVGNKIFGNEDELFTDLIRYWLVAEKSRDSTLPYKADIILDEQPRYLRGVGYELRAPRRFAMGGAHHPD